MNKEDNIIRQFIMDREQRLSKDHAGETAWGASLRWLKGIPNLIADMDHDGDVDAQDVMILADDQNKVWDLFCEFLFRPICVSSFPAKPRWAIMDSVVNLGGPRCAVLMQRAVRRLGGIVKIDGRVGPKTIEAINALEEMKFVQAFLFERLQFYQTLYRVDKEKYGKYINGWNSRVAMLERLINGN